MLLLCDEWKRMRLEKRKEGSCGLCLWLMERDDGYSKSEGEEEQ